MGGIHGEISEGKEGSRSRIVCQLVTMLVIQREGGESSPLY